jgi:hypothetical protein
MYLSFAAVSEIYKWKWLELAIVDARFTGPARRNWHLNTASVLSLEMSPKPPALADEWSRNSGLTVAFGP